MYDPSHPVPRWSTGIMRRVAQEQTLAEAALRYAHLGIPVFPCVPGGKQPLTPNGFKDATASDPTIARWWRRHPEANIGLPTGGPTGVVVVDVDVHATGSGYAAFERARSLGIAARWGWLVRTPSGGLHAYYPTNPRVEQRSWQAPRTHVDFRGDGGYVIAPPSRLDIDDRPITYAVIATAHQPARPVDAAALRAFLEPPRRRPHPAGVPTSGARPDKLAEWVATRPEGARNGGLFWAACRLVETGHDSNKCLALLASAAQTAGLGEREIESTIASAYRISARLSPAQTAPPGSRLGPTRPSEGITL